MNGVGRVGARARAVARERPAAADGDLEGPHDPAPVARLHPAGGDRVELLQASCRAAVSGSASSSAGRRGTARGCRGVDDGLHVQRRAAHEQRPVAPGLDVGDGGMGLALEPGDRAVLPRVEDVDQVVRHLGLLGRPSAWPCRCPCPGTPASSRPTRAPRSDPPGQGQRQGRLAGAWWPRPSAAWRPGSINRRGAAGGSCGSARGAPRPGRRAGGGGRRR